MGIFINYKVAMQCSSNGIAVKDRYVQSCYFRYNFEKYDSDKMLLTKVQSYR